MRVVITGGAGAGKSTVINRLKDVLGKDATFRDVDAIVRRIHRDPDTFFNSVQLEEWKRLVDVPNLRDAIFSDSTRRWCIESLSIPIVKAELNKPYDTPHMVLEFPVLFEKLSIGEIIKSFDLVVVLSCSEEIRRTRCEKRGWSAETISNVFAAQVSDMRRVKISDWLAAKTKVVVINTESTIESTIESVDELIQVIRPE